MNRIRPAAAPLLIAMVFMVAMVAMVAIVATPSGAIVRRHDRDDARYLEIGRGHPAVGSMLPVGDGAATLIAPRWAITAAHVAENISPFHPVIRFGDTLYSIETVHFHPSWGQEETGDYQAIDMALLHLADPVEAVEPVTPYRGTGELGKSILFIGWGDHGTGREGPEDNDGRRRGARNTVNEVRDNWITFLFDAPPGGDDLEGISGPGDSGGPALWESDEAVYLFGVGSGNDDFGRGIPACHYGTTEFYARVSTQADWIDATRRRPEGGRSFGAVVPIDPDGWPDSAAGRTAAAFFSAWSKPGNAMGAFDSTYRTAQALRDRPIEERLQSWERLRADWGDLVADRYSGTGPGDIRVLAQAKKSGEWLQFRFLLADQEPPKLKFISIGSDLPPDP